MMQDGSIKLFHYWNQLRDGRPAPRRTEIEPADIKTLLADTFILERDMRGAAVFRLAGTRLCAIYGRELKGFAFPSLWRARDQRIVERLTEGVFNAKDIVVMTYTGHSRHGRANQFELLLLPLDGGTESPRCLGIVSTSAKPFWLGADPVVDALLESVRVVDPTRDPVFLKNRPSVPVPSLAPENMPEPSPPEGMRRFRHLLVLDGGREGSSR